MNLQMVPFVLSLIPGTYISSYTLAYLTGIRHRKLLALLVTFLSVFWYCLCAVADVIPNAQFWNTAVQFGMLFLFGLVLTRGSIPRRILAPTVTLIALTIPEFTSSYIFIASHKSAEITSDVAGFLSSHPLSLLTLRASYIFIELIICVIVISIWNRTLRKTPTQVMKRFVMFPLSQGILMLISLIFMESHIQNSDYVYLYLGIFLAAIVLCVAADVILVKAIRQSTQKAAADVRAQWLEDLLEQQQTYYNQYMADAGDVARIRHDIRNQLQTAYTLIAEDDVESAKAILDGITEKLSHTASYCMNRLVNAILSVKGNLFEQSDIPFTFDCRIPDELPIPEVTLCSLYSNILDNAYTAASKCADVSAGIRLKSYIKNGFLFVSCSNPVAAASDAVVRPRRKGEPEEHHGLGLSILKNIADTHNGTMEIESGETGFTILMALSLADKN